MRMSGKVDKGTEREGVTHLSFLSLSLSTSLLFPSPFFSLSDNAMSWQNKWQQTRFDDASSLCAIVVPPFTPVRSSVACLFNPTKEMTYIPLNHDMKSKGKVATDLLGTTCGTAGSGLFQEGFLSITDGIELSIVPILIAIVLPLFGFWIYVTSALSKKYMVIIDTQPKKRN